MKGALVVTACVPVPESLRKSLRNHLTSNQSTALYRRFLVDILETTQNVEGMDYYLAYSPRGSREAWCGPSTSPGPKLQRTAGPSRSITATRSRLRKEISASPRWPRPGTSWARISIELAW